MSGTDPFAVPCPQCEAGLHEACFVPRTGRELPRPHSKRVKAAQDVLDAARRRAEGAATERIEGKRWRRLYTAAHVELEQRGDLTRLATEQLETLVRNMRAADECRQLAEATPIVTGSTGQPAANPAGVAALRYDAQALALARSLKLTPDTRGTAAPVDDGADDADDERPPEERDELAELDDLAARRKAKAAKAKPRKRARGK